MAIKKYFVDNAVYGVDVMNGIVHGLRTDGVDGETADSLLVTKGTGRTVYIAPGRGWVQGCQIAVTSTESRAVGSADGTYSVIMQLTQEGDGEDARTVDIDLAVVEGAQSGPHVLAHLAVSGGAITVTDTRQWSRAVGNTTTPVSIQSGRQTFTGTVSSGGRVTKTVAMPAGTVKVLGFMKGLSPDGQQYGAEYGAVWNNVLQFSVGQGLEYLFGTQIIRSNAVARFPLNVVTGTLTTKDTDTAYGFGQFATSNTYVRVASMSLTGAGLVIVLENVGSGSQSYDFEILWEAWNYDTV